MVNKLEKNLLYNFYFRQTAILFFIFITFLLLFFFPYLFRFNFVVSERNVHIPFIRHIWAELSLLFWTFLSGTFFPGGRVHVHPVHPPLRTRLKLFFCLNLCKNPRKNERSDYKM